MLRDMVSALPGSAVTLRLPSPVVELDDDRLAAAGIRLAVKRDDLIHPALPGNKWRKLKYNLVEAKAAGHHTLLTFGGAYSNHLRATAAAGHLFGFRTIGVVRGEEHLPLNPCLAYAAGHGMRLTYLDRGGYRTKEEPAFIESLRSRWGRFYLLAEGGSNTPAVRGCAELAGELAEDFDVICCPVGTGGTLAGIAAGLGPGRRAIGFSVLKGGEFLAQRVEHLQRSAFGRASRNWHIEFGHHFGGYARSTPALDAFVADFADRHGMDLDRIYVAKMMYGIISLAGSGAIDPGSTVVAVITG